MVTTQSVFHGDCIDWMSSHTVWCVGVFLSQFKPWFELAWLGVFSFSSHFVRLHSDNTLMKMRKEWPCELTTHPKVKQE